MEQASNIGVREREILTAVVETFIATGEPVGSRTLARANSEGLSAATIRNVMADLSEAGLLEQPHTSAGRVPTAAAYRYYVEQITGKTRLAPAEADRDIIHGSLEGITDVQEFLERTSHVLSLISHSVGVTVAGGGSRNALGGGSRNALEHVYFSRQGDNKILAVLVTKSGLVRDRLLRMERPLSQQDLEIAARYINENFRGWTIAAVRTELERRIEQERGEYDRLMQSLEELYKQGALSADKPGQTVYVEGAANLLASEQDTERLSQLLRTLEEKEKVAELLAAYVDTRQEAVRVVIGLEETTPNMSNVVLIGAPARAGDEVVGSLAVIGPTRIDYQHTISAVSYIARLFDRILNEQE